MYSTNWLIEGNLYDTVHVEKRCDDAKRSGENIDVEEKRYDDAKRSGRKYRCLLFVSRKRVNRDKKGQPVDSLCTKQTPIFLKKF